MPQGVPLQVPDDGLTTRARRHTPVLAGPGGQAVVGNLKRNTLWHKRLPFLFAPAVRLEQLHADSLTRAVRDAA
ncbi:hypothetical protein MAHJHV57_51780 [Mycobacterium avium subsp. hominissuis]